LKLGRRIQWQLRLKKQLSLLLRQIAVRRVDRAIFLSRQHHSLGWGRLLLPLLRHTALRRRLTGVLLRGLAGYILRIARNLLP
jgi:hypothetical protein